MDQGLCNSWLYDILVWTGMIEDTVRGPAYEKAGKKYRLTYDVINQQDKYVKAAFLGAVAVKKALLYRQVDYKWYLQIDQALEALSKMIFGTNPALGPKEKTRCYTPEEMAEFIANICAQRKWWWDSLGAHITKYELAEMNKTIIGAALLKYKCYTHQSNTPKTEDLKEWAVKPEDHAVHINIDEYCESLAHEL